MLCFSCTLLSHSLFITPAWMSSPWNVWMTQVGGVKVFCVHYTTSIVEKGFSWVARVLLGLCFCSGVIVWQIIQYPHWSIHVSLYVLCCVCVRGVAVPGHVSVCLCVCVCMCACVYGRLRACACSIYISLVTSSCIYAYLGKESHANSGTVGLTIIALLLTMLSLLLPLDPCMYVDVETPCLWGTLSLRHPVWGCGHLNCYCKLRAEISKSTRCCGLVMQMCGGCTAAKGHSYSLVLGSLCHDWVH